MIREQKMAVVPRARIAAEREKLEKKGMRLIEENSRRIVYTDGIDYYILVYPMSEWQ